MGMLLSLPLFIAGIGIIAFALQRKPSTDSAGKAGT
jgi:hypothetical protein